MGLNICLLNDSFPPQMDGVANTVLNYAVNINKNHGKASVVTPEFPEKDDSVFDFPVIRYPSLETRKIIGYMTGVPFSPQTMKRLNKANVDLIHTHCPAMSLILARKLVKPLDAPLVLTYHTKYDIDLKRSIKFEKVTDSILKIMVNNINFCDEVWTVSHGAGKNLQSLGYEGEYRVMENGVDMPLGRVSDEEVAEACKGLDLPEGVPVFLFVGRMMWYKGIPLILDAMAELHARNTDFRMVFIGGGGDFDEIVKKTESMGLKEKIFFTGPIRDRQILRAWYCRASLFVFPSTYDTNGLVVREAAASSLASILIADSCAAEGVTGDRNGFLVEENAASLAAKLYELTQHPEKMREVGEMAARELYLSWEDSVARAVAAYEVIIENHKSGVYANKKHFSFSQMMYNRQGDLMKSLGKLPTWAELSLYDDDYYPTNITPYL